MNNETERHVKWLLGLSLEDLEEATFAAEHMRALQDRVAEFERERDAFRTAIKNALKWEANPKIPAYKKVREMGIILREALNDE